MKIEQPETSALVWITWRDACEQRLGEDEDADTAGLALNVNLGWIISENRERIILSRGFSDTGEQDVIAIPTGWIVSAVPAISRRPGPAIETSELFRLKDYFKAKHS